MSVLTINSGSTSVKLALYGRGPAGQPERRDTLRYPGTAAPLDALAAAQARVGAPEAVVHRVVHGGERFTRPVVIEAEVAAQLRQLAALAPLHNPVALRWIEAAQAVWPHACHVAVFDTAFFRELPRVAAEYALAPRFGTAQGVRRYGFHGLAHQAMWEAWCAMHPQLERGGRLITIQLGGGCSMTAIAHGRPLDTSMGFSPLEGLVMATRSGDIDPAVIPYLAQRLAIGAEAVVELLNEQAGLRGLAGCDDAPAQLLTSTDARAHFALELYCYRIRKYLGAFLAVLGGCDGVAFGGGVGEHVPQVRARALDGMAWAGIAVDAARNNAAGGGALISAATASVPVAVIAVDEEALLARAAFTVMAAATTSR